MKVDKDKPLDPVAKKDSIGVVLDAFIRVDRKMQEKSSGTSDEDRVILDITMNNTWPREDGTTDTPVPIPEPGAIIEITQEDVIEEVKNTVNTKLDAMSALVETELLTHTNKQGPVHGENKETVGLGDKENWGMASLEQHRDGTADDLYCHPAGLAAIIEERVKVDPRSYIPARVFPMAVGGILGEVPQWHYDYYKGELVQSGVDPKNHLGETALQFSTPSGMQIFPCLNNSPELGRYTVSPTGSGPEVQTLRGGTKVRAYARRTDIRRSRPSHLRGWAASNRLGTILKVSENMFDRSAISYMEGTQVCLRSFNRTTLPFDVLEMSGRNKPFNGIFESSENYLFNLELDVKKSNYPGETNSELHLVLDSTIYLLNNNDLEIQDGPPNRVPEYVTVDPTKYKTTAVTLPVNSKMVAVDYAGNGQQAIVIPFKNLFDLSTVDMDEFTAQLDVTRIKRMTFAWRSKLRCQGVIRLYLGWHNKDKTSYWHTYLDLDVEYFLYDNNKTATVTVKTGSAWDLNKQTLTSNWDLTGTGLMTHYTSHVKEQPEHPLCQDGVFESVGGHFRTVTLYNRQYIGLYQHNVGLPIDFINLGRTAFPKPTKYSYNAQSTVNQDGMYGDHLRHIPISVVVGVASETDRVILDITMNNTWARLDGITDPPIPMPDPGEITSINVTYLTYTRDYRNRYRWCLVTADANTPYIQGNPYGSYLAPHSKDITWLDDTTENFPSFLIENDDLSNTMNINNMVFNEDNHFTNYLNYTFDPEQPSNPITFSNPISVHDEILTWISTNAGNWNKHHKVFFYFKSTLFWMIQCTSAPIYPTNGKDCFYGMVKNCFVHTDTNGRKTIRTTGNVSSNIVVNTMNVNKKSTLQVNHGTILGYDQFKTQDVYIMKESEFMNEVKYNVMLNVAPFNNFFIELKIVRNPLTGEMTFGPSLDAVDPVFPFDPENGYQIDYDKEILYGTKLPHRLHINFQSPVMLSKGMWSFRKTPNNFGIFTREHGFMVMTGGIMGTMEGFTFFPMGGVITVEGKNTILKKPVKGTLEQFFGYDEVFVKAVGGEFTAYGRYNNPLGYELEPHIGAVPAGFINGTEFSYQDQSGWRNAFFPILENKRMNYTSDGSSFPVFLGKPGSKLPINRFFKQTIATRLMWDTSKGRVIPIINRVGGTPTISINGTSYPLSGLVSFTIPGTHTGIVTVDIFGVSVLKWGLGMTELVTIGSRVTELDFSGSATFKVTATLPKQIANFNGVFKNSTAANYPGLEFWEMGSVYTMNECFKGCVNLNQDLSHWYLGRIATYFNYDEGTTAWVLPKPTFPPHIR